MDNLGVKFVIFDQKDIHIGKRTAICQSAYASPRLGALVDIERDFNIERTAHTKFARDFDGATHHIDERFNDCHADARSLELATGIVALLGKRFVDVR